MKVSTLFCTLLSLPAAICATAVAQDVQTNIRDYLPCDGSVRQGAVVQIARDPSFVELHQAAVQRFVKLPKEKQEEINKVSSANKLMPYSADLWPDKAEYERYKEAWKKSKIVPRADVALGLQDNGGNTFSVLSATRRIAPGGALEALMAAREQGKIRHIGLTAHSAAVFERALDLPWVETVMFPYNIVETQGEDLIRRCHEKNIGFICMKPLAGGALDDGTLALRFIVNNPHVDVVIPGMADPSELTENMAAVSNTAPLTQEEIEKIEELRNTLGTEFCRRCNYCAPCTVGISIPSAFLFEGYLTRYGLPDWAKQRYATLSVKASACIECGDCESRCPYNLPIRQMLKRVVKNLE